MMNKLMLLHNAENKPFYISMDGFLTGTTSNGITTLFFKGTADYVVVIEDVNTIYEKLCENKMVKPIIVHGKESNNRILINIENITLIEPLPNGINGSKINVGYNGERYLHCNETIKKIYDMITNIDVA